VAGRIVTVRGTADGARITARRITFD